MYFGDLYQNTATGPAPALNRFPPGRNAFYQWIKDSLANGKPYNQMATELICRDQPTTATPMAPPTSWSARRWSPAGPKQDIMDQMTADHVRHLPRHDARQLPAVPQRPRPPGFGSACGATSTTRYQAWQLASFLSHTSAARTPVDPAQQQHLLLVPAGQSAQLHGGLHAEHHHRQPSGAPVVHAGCKSGSPATTCRRSISSTANLSQVRRRLTASRWRAASPAISSSRAPP